MAFDPDQVTPCGLTYAQIDAKQAEYVRGANDALAELRDRGCRWWLYSVSHCTFEVVVGDPHARDNLVITVGESDWAQAFERSRIDGLWAYKPLAQPIVEDADGKTF